MLHDVTVPTMSTYYYKSHAPTQMKLLNVHNNLQLGWWLDWPVGHDVTAWAEIRDTQETPGDTRWPTLPSHSATNLLDTNLGTTLGLLTNDGNPAFSTFFLSLLLHTTFVLKISLGSNVQVFWYRIGKDWKIKSFLELLTIELYLKFLIDKMIWVLLVSLPLCPYWSVSISNSQ